MDAHPCSACAASRFEPRSRIDDVGGKLVTVYEGECENCGAYRYSEFQLDNPLPPPQTDEAIVIGTGTSSTLDADDFEQAATRLAVNVPADSSKLDDAARGRAVYQLRLAIGALDEARKLSGGSSAARLATRRAELVSRLALVRTGR